MPGWTCFRGTTRVLTRVANGAAVASPQQQLPVVLFLRQRRVREVVMVPLLALKQPPPPSPWNYYHTGGSGSRRSHSNNNSGISGSSLNHQQISPCNGTTDDTDDEDQLDRQRYTELTKEYQAITKDTVPKFSLKLYRTIMRAIYKQVQHGNQHDHDEFEKREERQRRHLESSSSSMHYGGPEAVAIPELLSLVDTLPINREEELQSRKNYYIQYTRENFLQSSDVLQDLPPPVDRVRERKRNFDYHHNNNNNSSNSNSSHTNNKPHMLIDDGPIPHQTIRYTTEREEQYAMIQRWIHVVQQGYIHLDWILRDMKFVPPTTTSSATTTSMTTRSKNRIQTNRSVVDRQKQQEIRAIQLQMQLYVDHVLQYNLQINHPIDNHVDDDDDMLRRRTSSRPMSDTTWTVEGPAFVETTMKNVGSGHHATDIEWSDDDDDDE